MTSLINSKNLQFWQEFLTLFETIGAAETNNIALSESALEWLEANILKYPSLINWIIENCLSLPMNFASQATDSDLHKIYFNSINKLLDISIDTEAMERCANRSCKNGVLLSIISKMKPADSNKEQIFDWLYSTLLEKFHNSTNLACNFDNIELALYSRKDLTFFKHWHQFIDDTCARNQQPTTDTDNLLEISSILSKTIFTNQYSLTSPSSSSSHFKLNANEVFKRVLSSQSHWFNDIMVRIICFFFKIRGAYISQNFDSITISVIRDSTKIFKKYLS